MIDRTIKVDQGNSARISSISKHSGNYKDSSMNKELVKQKAMKNKLEMLRKKIEMKEQSNKLILIEMEKKNQRNERIRMTAEEARMRQHLLENQVKHVVRIQKYIRQRKINKMFKWQLKSEKEKLGRQTNHQIFFQKYHVVETEIQQSLQADPMIIQNIIIIQKMFRMKKARRVYLKLKNLRQIKRMVLIQRQQRGQQARKIARYLRKRNMKVFQAIKRVILKSRMCMYTQNVFEDSDIRFKSKLELMKSSLNYNKRSLSPEDQDLFTVPKELYTTIRHKRPHSYRKKYKPQRYMFFDNGMNYLNLSEKTKEDDKNEERMSDSEMESARPLSEESRLTRMSVKSKKSEKGGKQSVKKTIRPKKRVKDKEKIQPGQKQEGNPEVDLEEVLSQEATGPEEEAVDERQHSETQQEQEQKDLQLRDALYSKDFQARKIQVKADINSMHEEMIDHANLDHKLVRTAVELGDDPALGEQVLAVHKEPHYASVHSKIQQSIQQDRSFANLAEEHFRPLTQLEKDRLELENNAQKSHKNEDESPDDPHQPDIPKPVLNLNDGEDRIADEIKPEVVKENMELFEIKSLSGEEKYLLPNISSVAHVAHTPSQAQDINVVEELISERPAFFHASTFEEFNEGKLLVKKQDRDLAFSCKQVFEKQDSNFPSAFSLVKSQVHKSTKSHTSSKKPTFGLAVDYSKSDQSKSFAITPSTNSIYRSKKKDKSNQLYSSDQNASSLLNKSSLDQSSVHYSILNLNEPSVSFPNLREESTISNTKLSDIKKLKEAVSTAKSMYLNEQKVLNKFRIKNDIPDNMSFTDEKKQ